LAGEAIPMGARLFAVIDTLDAMTSDRPYRRGVSFDAAKAEIEAMANRQFDPIAVDAMSSVQELLRKMVDMKCAQINASDF
jgi:HD-GYP domain-containing protein (c-di-GMP phosphodiesterase class II)